MQYTYDDGSTITLDGNTVSSTPTPAGWAASDYGENITPGSTSPGAQSWTDVLKYGFGRAVDYATTKQTPQNTPITYAKANGATLPGGGALGVSSGTLLLGAVVIGGLLIAMKMAASKG